MKITIEIPDGTMCMFLNSIEYTQYGLQMACYRLDSDDLTDGNTIKLPREKEK